LPRLKIEKKGGKEKPTGAKPADVLNWQLSPQVIASPVDERLGGDGKIGFLKKPKTVRSEAHRRGSVPSPQVKSSRKKKIFKKFRRF